MSVKVVQLFEASEKSIQSPSEDGRSVHVELLLRNGSNSSFCSTLITTFFFSFLVAYYLFKTNMP